MQDLLSYNFVGYLWCFILNPYYKWFLQPLLCTMKKPVPLDDANIPYTVISQGV